MKILTLLGAMLFAVRPVAAQTSRGWPETIELLAQQRTQAETCVETLKSSSDNAAVATGRLTYGAAKSQSDGVIAGLTLALVDGGKPDALPTALTSLRKAGEGFSRGLQRGADGGFRRGIQGLGRRHPKSADRAGRERDFVGRQRAVDGSCREGQARIGDDQRTT
jgi:hypothetical protein